MNKIKKLFTKYIKIKEILLFSSLLLASNFSYLILTWLFPDTGEPTFVWLYWLIFGITRAIAIIGIGYLILSLMIPKAFIFIEEKLFKNETNEIDTWKQIKLYTYLYSFFIVVILMSVITMGQ